MNVVYVFLLSFQNFLIRLSSAIVLLNLTFISDFY